MPYRTRAAALLLVITVAAVAAVPARADATFLIGLHTPSAPSSTVGVSIGRARGAIGWEVEIAMSGTHTPTHARAGCLCWNLIFQPPVRVRSAGLYVIAGFGLYGEVGGNRTSTGPSLVADPGVGLKVPISGALKLRLEYRAFLGQSSESERAIHSQRAAVGLSVAF